jgi:hypothetical protein
VDSVISAPSLYYQLTIKKSHKMATKIFINLPVADLQKAMSFYTAI